MCEHRRAEFLVGRIFGVLVFTPPKSKKITNAGSADLNAAALGDRDISAGEK